MNVSQARKDKPQEESDLDLKNRRGPKAQKEKPLKEVAHCARGPASIQSVLSCNLSRSNGDS